MITEDYVSFETAKLLKDKGFNEKAKSYFTDDGLAGYMFGTGQKSNSELEDYFYSRPTLQMAMKWLREVHNIAVSVYVFNRDLPVKENGIRYTCDIATAKMSSKEGHLRLTGTYEEACEYAIKYCLENLI